VVKYLLIYCDGYWSVLLVSEDFVAKKCYCCNQPVGTYTLLQYTPVILDHGYLILNWFN